MPNVFQGQPGQAIETTRASSSDLPSWYQDYTQNIGKQATNIANQNMAQPLPTKGVADFNSMQDDGFAKTLGDQGMWRPGFDAANRINGQIAPRVSGMVDNAQAAAAGPAQAVAGQVGGYASGAVSAAQGGTQNWVDNASKYMSPYTSAVVDNIGRLGQRNWNENIMPGVNQSMLGAGQFGSTRNADILSRAGVQASSDITGQQAGALESGYRTGSDIYAGDEGRALQNKQNQTSAQLGAGNMVSNALTGDANRAQQQQQMQTNAELQGAGALTQAYNTAGNNAANFARNGQLMANNDTKSLMDAGGLAQSQDQRVLDTNYANGMSARSDPWTQLSNMKNAVTGVSLPTTQTAVDSGPANAYAPSPVSGALSAYFLARGLNADGSPKTGGAPAQAPPATGATSYASPVGAAQLNASPAYTSPVGALSAAQAAAQQAPDTAYYASRAPVAPPPEPELSAAPYFAAAAQQAPPTPNMQQTWDPANGFFGNQPDDTWHGPAPHEAVGSVPTPPAPQNAQTGAYAAPLNNFSVDPSALNMGPYRSSGVVY